MNKNNLFHDIHEECGIFGIFGHPEAANLTYLGLYALQHRGQEGAGICSSDGVKLYLEKSLGLVAEIFNEKVLRNLPGHIAIGHNRYSTTGSSTIENVQPLMATYSLGSIAIAHNGNLVDIDGLKSRLEKDGAIFQTTSDSEIILHLIARAKDGQVHERIANAVRQVRGAFSLLLMNEKELIAIRDPFGIRPLSLGQLKDAYVLASETCAFDLIGATYIRDIEPGEMLIIDENGARSIKIFNSVKKAHCVFEFIYFARPDSYIFDHTCVNTIRKELGRQLAREHPIDADIVIPVPDSGVPAALGYAEQSGIPFEFGLIRNHYVGRTFIEPKQSIRHFGVKIKLNPVREVLKGKKVIVIDDSIVRGTTSKKIVKMIRELGGAKEVHMRISSPPTVGPCFYGIDTPTRQELIASSHKIEEIRKYITADSLGYLSLEGLKKIIPNSDLYCMACFNCKYPIEFEHKKITQMELFS
ncbi:amidophosphoribosyltransferase [Thermodesulfovibrio aggregans]|uniref:Amidophosphoribosyltransferase n=1 Tax=Thermodesulfovibrio aggregans TaxID=86166 RepID=A0A0U9HPR1_9BACT|nr:amidophosphoribosyltransferase [Thermodesulfovibrio aggregans]GAQ94162.1 amidophosphoribosyltransferase [Thermodesulfovibrio aggregans]